MWCSVRTSSVLVLGLVLALGSLLLPVHGEEVTTQVTVRNGLPEITQVEVLFDARLGLFHYEVRATDPNGGPDLDRLVFHFLDADDRLWTHRDTDPEPAGSDATWSGLTNPGLKAYRAPFRVHLHVYDVNDAHADADAPVTPISHMLDEVREARGDIGDTPPDRGSQGPLRALTQRVVAVDPLPFGILAAAGLLAAGTVLVVAAGLRGVRSVEEPPAPEPARVRLKALGPQRSGRLRREAPDGPAGGRPRGGP